MAQQFWNDPVAKIEEFSEAFKQLRADLDTGILHQIAIVTSRVADGVEILGTFQTSFHFTLE